MKIAVPTEATAGTTIATQPTTIASTPTAISAFQLRASPSRTSGSIDAPPISMPQTLSAAHPDDDQPRELGARLGARSGVV